MSTNDKNEDVLNTNHCSSFFKNSCQGNGFISEEKAVSEHDILETNEMEEGNADDVEWPNSRKSGGCGGYTCCVPECFSNSKRDKELSFYSFPEGKSKEKQFLRNRWIHMVCRKNFKPTTGHRVCSKHFPGGKKMYMNNVPTITPKTEKVKPVIPRPTTKSRNREARFHYDELEDDFQNDVAVTDNIEMEYEEAAEQQQEQPCANNAYSLKERVQQLEEENRALKVQNEKLRKENSLLLEKVARKSSSFSLESFKSDNKMFKFYTGLPNY